MPIDVEQGLPVTFTVNFYSSAGAITQQTSANMNLSWTSSQGALQASVLPMTPNGLTFTATWASSVGFGIVNCVASTGFLASAAKLQLRMTLP